MNGSANVYEVTIQDFMVKVVEESKKRPVVVDFWAEWCGPCKMLGPILERVVESYHGKIALAKVDTEANQELAMQFRIQSIPAVKIIKDGQLAHEFTGAIPEEQIRQVLSAVLGDDGMTDQEKAKALFEQGALDEAESVYNGMLINEPENVNAHLGIAKIAIRRGETDKARAILESFDEDTRLLPEVKSLLAGIDYAARCDSSGGLDAAREAADANPDDLDARFAYAACLVGEQHYEEAFEAFMTILRKNVDYGDGAAREGMLALFEILGQESPLTSAYRTKLASLLF